MAKSFQKEKPPARINLTLEVDTGGAQKKIELPLRMLMVGDYTGREDGTALEDRELITINKSDATVDKVMKDLDLQLKYTVPNRLKKEEGEEMSVDLKIDDMKAFNPEQVALQVPELKRMLAMRNLLEDLRNRVVSMKQFGKQLGEIVKDKDALEALTAELNRIVAEDEGGAPEAGD